MASEPVAFHLYKARHFHQFEKAQTQGGELDEDDDRKDYRFQLLDTANARIIGPVRFKKMIDECVEKSWKLDHKIINLPKHLEAEM